MGTNERQVTVNCYPAGNSCLKNSDGQLALGNGSCFFCCYTGSSFRSVGSTQRFEGPDYRGDSSSCHLGCFKHFIIGEPVRGGSYLIIHQTVRDISSNHCRDQRTQVKWAHDLSWYKQDSEAQGEGND